MQCTIHCMHVLHYANSMRQTMIEWKMSFETGRPRDVQHEDMGYF